MPRLADISAAAAHPRQPRRRPPHRRQAPGPDGGDRADDPPVRPHHHRHHRALRAGLDDAGELLGDRAARWRGSARPRSRCPAAAPSARGRSTSCSWRWSSSAPRSRSMPATSSPRAPKGLQGGEIVFPKVTVGGTHVALMAAALASGTTRDRERRPRARGRRPCRLPDQDGRADRAAPAPARSSSRACARLHGATHEVLPDRIETGTYAMAVAMTGGDVLLENTRPDLLRLGARRARPDRRRGDRDERGHPRPPQRQRHRSAVDVTTDPFPGFPTDLQAQFMALMTRAKRHLAHPRDDLREPLHARAGAGAPRRPHPPRRRRAPWSRASSASRARR